VRGNHSAATVTVSAARLARRRRHHAQPSRAGGRCRSPRVTEASTGRPISAGGRRHPRREAHQNRRFRSLLRRHGCQARPGPRRHPRARKRNPCRTRPRAPSGPAQAHAANPIDYRSASHPLPWAEAPPRACASLIPARQGFPQRVFSVLRGGLELYGSRSSVGLGLATSAESLGSGIGLQEGPWDGLCVLACGSGLPRLGSALLLPLNREEGEHSLDSRLLTAVDRGHPAVPRGKPLP